MDKEERPKVYEALAILSEECGEVVQAVGKIQRFGLDSAHPITKETNRAELEKELGHIMSAVNRLCEMNVVSSVAIGKSAVKKDDSVKPFLIHCDK